MSTEWISEIAMFHPCQDAWNWLHRDRFSSLQAAWDACPRGDWMLWLLQRTKGATQQQLVNIACDCAERVLPHTGSASAASEAAIALARRWAAGEAVTQQELWDAAGAAADAAANAASWAAASAASWAAADAAYAASYAADAAAYATANAADAAARAAAYAAAYAANAAARAAAYAAAYAANAAAREEERQAQADIVRKWVPVAPRLA